MSSTFPRSSDIVSARRECFRSPAKPQRCYHGACHTDTVCLTDAAHLRQQPAHAVANAALRLLADREQELLLRSIFGPLAAASLVTKCGVRCRLSLRYLSWSFAVLVLQQRRLLSLQRVDALHWWRIAQASHL